jgi:hypothetical protein
MSDWTWHPVLPDAVYETAIASYMSVVYLVSVTDDALYLDKISGTYISRWVPICTGETASTALIISLCCDNGDVYYNWVSTTTNSYYIGRVSGTTADDYFISYDPTLYEGFTGIYTTGGMVYDNGFLCLARTDATTTVISKIGLDGSFTEVHSSFGSSDRSYFGMQKSDSVWIAYRGDTESAIGTVDTGSAAFTPVWTDDTYNWGSNISYGDWFCPSGADFYIFWKLSTSYVVHKMIGGSPFLVGEGYVWMPAAAVGDALYVVCRDPIDMYTQYVGRGSGSYTPNLRLINDNYFKTF